MGSPGDPPRSVSHSRARNALVQHFLQRLRAQQAAKFGERPRLNLPDSFFRHAEVFAHLFQRLSGHLAKAEAERA
jgi:hypothetical protein